MLWIDDFYPVSPRPRWGFGLPVHARIQKQLEKYRREYESALDEIDRHRDALYAIPETLAPGAVGPFWHNAWFSCLDAASLVGLLLSRKPRCYLEIGSGHSTLFARHAIAWGKLETKLVSIDPSPRAEIDSLCDETVRHALEDIPPGYFDRLEPGDVLFFDGTHRVFQNSDTTAFFFDVLPRLRPGVLVHIHDVFLPADYPPQWGGRYYSEQYLLAAMLLCEAPPFRVVLPNFFACTDERLAPRIKAIFEARPGGAIPFLYGIDAQVPGVSFWIETA